MTLRTKEIYLAEELKKQLKDEFPLNLTEDGPIYGPLHPKLILAKFHFEESPDLPTEVVVPGWHFVSYPDVSSAKKDFSHIDLEFTGRPWTIFKFLSENRAEAIVDFPGIGTAVLSREPLQQQGPVGLHQHLVPAWLGYALSPELWGPQGKWTRFHERLHSLFKAHQLLESESVPGRYVLKGNASSLAQQGFQGTNLDKSYLLVLPWTFSLSALSKLESIIQQEF